MLPADLFKSREQIYLLSFCHWFRLSCVPLSLLELGLACDGLPSVQKHAKADDRAMQNCRFSNVWSRDCSAQVDRGCESPLVNHRKIVRVLDSASHDSSGEDVTKLTNTRAHTHTQRHTLNEPSPVRE